MDYEQLMEEAKRACRERQACRNGYDMLIRSKNVQEVLLTAVKNWDYVWRSKFYDVVADNIDRWFEGLEQEFHAAGIYVNEPTDKGIAIVSNAEETLVFEGRARVYIFARSRVIAKGGAQVYCRDSESIIELYGRAYGYVEQGMVVAHDWSEVESRGVCYSYDYCKVRAFGGILHDYGHRRLNTDNGVKFINH